MKKDDRVYLLHMLEAIAQIQDYTKGLDCDRFKSSRLVQDGVIRQLEILGEATKTFPAPPAPRPRKFPGKIWPACGMS